VAYRNVCGADGLSRCARREQGRAIEESEAGLCLAKIFTAFAQGFTRANLRGEEGEGYEMVGGVGCVWLKSDSPTFANSMASRGCACLLACLEMTSRRGVTLTCLSIFCLISDRCWLRWRGRRAGFNCCEFEAIFSKGYRKYRVGRVNRGHA